MTAPFTFFAREIRSSSIEADTVCLQLRGLLKEGPPHWRRECFAVELLAREALANAVRHGCGGDENRRVRFSCRIGSRRIVLKVEDEGPGFDWRAALGRPVEEDDVHGRGMALFRLYASRVLFNPSGNRVLLVRPFPESTMSEPNEGEIGNQATLHPGDLTASTVDRVRDQLKALIRAGSKDLTLDLAGVQMVDSMGIGLLIQTHNTLAKAGGRLTVKHASGDLLELFRSMRLDKRFSVQD